MSSDKPPVTCHVLNTTLGKPAPGIPCTLSRFLKTSDGTPSSSFEVARALTNPDGRVTAWEMRQKGVAGRLDLQEGFTYKIRFDTWEYFGGETFFPYVEVVFTVKDPAEHYHIPLLLSPYSYSTYRGS
jgi:5-hydroxyisourate hydrolase